MDRKRIIKCTQSYWWLWLILSIAVGLFWFRSSALYNGTNRDGAVFLTVGRGILEGKVPYMDLFDHKGPVLYFIQAFTQWIHKGFITVWLLETLFLFVTLVLLFKTVRLLLDTAPAVLTVFIYILFTLRLYEGGNLTESYTAPFSVLALYFMIKVFIMPESEVRPWYGFVLGICFMFTFLLRANNAVVAAGATASLVLLLILQRKWIILLRNIGAFFVGAVVVMLPVCAYYIANHAFADFINGAFLYNFLYVSEGTWRGYFSSHEMVRCFGWMMIGGLSGGCACLFGKNRGFSARLLGGSVLFISLLMGYSVSMSRQPYLHYLIIGAPVMVLGIALFLRWILPLLGKIQLPVRYITVVLCLLVMMVGGIRTYQFNSSNQEWRTKLDYDQQKALETAAKIPPEERDSVWGYNVEPVWYVHTDVLPCFCYFALQDWMSIANPQIDRETLAMLQKNPPLWIVTNDKEHFAKEIIQSEILDKYRLTASNGEQRLYRLK